MKNEKLNFVEFGGSRKSQIKADFSGKKEIQFVLRSIGAGGNLVPRALFPGFGGGVSQLQSQGKAPWGRGWAGGRGWLLSSFPSHLIPCAQGNDSGRQLVTSQGLGGPYKNPTAVFQKVCKCPTPGQHQYCILLQISCKCHILHRKSVRIWSKHVKHPSQIVSSC